jgi:1,4-alpha-glucan branching enzyme
LVLSHDEVVHGKGSLLSRMPGDYWQKFANLRLLLTYMMCQPGKKMLFMGGELGQWNEWNCKEEIHWHLLQFPIHHSIQTLVKDINHFYLNSPALWERDFDYTGFEWVDFSDVDNGVICYRRKASQETELLCVHHFTPNFHPHYFIHLRQVKSIREVFNSDEEKYAGSGKKNENIEIVRNDKNEAEGVHLQLAPLATMIFEIRF